jgi:hypothetical protein
MSHSLKEISSSGIHFVWCDVQQNKIKRRLDRSQTLTLSGAMCNKTKLSDVSIEVRLSLYLVRCATKQDLRTVIGSRAT